MFRLRHLLSLAALAVALAYGAPAPAQTIVDEWSSVKAPPAPELVDINMFFDDYKSVDGVMLPHHITRSVDGQPTEEWTFKTIKVNPAFRPDTFSGK